MKDYSYDCTYQCCLYLVEIFPHELQFTKSVPRYISQRINRRVNARKLRSTATPLLIQPFARTDFAKRTFRCAAPSVCNSFPASVIYRKRLTVCFQI